MLSRYHRSYIHLATLFLFVALAACSQPDLAEELAASTAVPENPTSTDTPAPTSMPAVTSSPTATNIPSATPTQTPSPTPLPTTTPTLTPLPTATPTPAPISLSNAAQLKPIARIAESVPYWVDFSSDGRLVALATTNGVEIYDADTLERIDLIQADTPHVTSVKFSPDNDRLLLTLPKGLVQLIDSRSGENHTSFQHPAEVKESAFSPTGEYFATIAEDNHVRLWNAETGDLHKDIAPRKFIGRVAYSPDGQIVATSGNYDVSLWDTQTGDLITSFGSGDDVYLADLVFSADGNTVATARGDGLVQLWDIELGQRYSTLNSGGADWNHTPESLAFHPDGERLAVVFETGEVEIWSIAARAVVQRLESRFQSGGSPGRRAIFSGDGEKLAIFHRGFFSGLMRSGPVQLIDVSTGGESIFTRSGRPAQIAFLGNEELVALYSNGQLKSWSPQEGMREMNDETDRDIRYDDLAVSPDGQWIAAGRDDGVLEIWDAIDPAESTELLAHTEAIWDLDFSSNGELLATGSTDGFARIWEVGTWSQLESFAHSRSGYRNGVDSIEFFDDDQWLAVATYGRIEFHPLTDEGAHFAVPATEYFMSGLEITASDSLLVANNMDDFVLLRKMNALEDEPVVLPHVDSYEIILTSDESTLITSGGEEIVLWDSDSGNELARYSLDINSSDMALSPDGKTLATLDWSGEIMIWQAAAP